MSENQICETNRKPDPNSPFSGGGSGPQNVSWTNAVGASVSGNNLTKTAADGWNNSGASSTQTIASGDGYVEFTATETTTARLCGLSHSDPDQNYGVDFALGIWPSGVLYRFEAGSYAVIGSYSTGDLLRVAVEGGVVKYKKNGIVVYTSAIAPTYPLLVDTSLHSNGSTLSNVVISSGSGGGGSSSAQIHWLVTDQLGTPRMVFDQTGSLANVSRHDYLPFGEELYAGTGGRTSAQGYTLSDNVRQKFTQKERDIETGLDYFEARYYASIQGRFTSADPLLASGRPGSPQSWNRYTYVMNNPGRLVDPSGLEGEESEDQQKKKQEKKSQPQVVDLRKDQTITQAVDTIKANASPLSKGEAPQLTCVIMIAGETTKITNGTLIDAYGGEAPNFTGTVRPVAIVPLDQGGNVIADGNGVVVEEYVQTKSGQPPDTTAAAPSPKGGVFIDIHTISPGIPTTTIVQDVVVSQGRTAIQIGPNKITKDPSAGTISFTKGRSTRLQ